MEKVPSANPEQAMAEDELPKISFLAMDDTAFPALKSDKEKAQKKAFLTMEQLYKNMTLGSLNEHTFPLTRTNAEHIVDTTLPLNISSGKRFTGAMLIALKVRQAELGAPTPEFISSESLATAQKNGCEADRKVVDGKRKERGVAYTFLDKDSSKWKTIYYYNLSQIDGADKLREYARNVYKEQRAERQAFLKEKYGDKAYEMADKELPGLKAADMSATPMVCSGKDAVDIVAQYIVAGQQGKPLRMYPGEREMLEKELSSVLTSEKKNAFFDFGKKVNARVVEYDKQMNVEKRKAQKSPAEEQGMER